MAIPKIIHFVYGFDDSSDEIPFHFFHWVAIKSALKLNPDYQAKLWCKKTPTSYYFNDVKNQLELELIEPPEHIFNNKLYHYAHKCDVVRLQKLIEFGGVYLDIDTITVKSFDELLDNQFVMGREVVDEKVLGLCNAIMLSEKNSTFAKTWLTLYKEFRSKGLDEYWGEHSINAPYELSKKLVNDITVLDNEAFFYPDWTESGLDKMFFETNDFEKAYAHHLWNATAKGALSKVNEFNVDKIENSYTKMIMKILKDEMTQLKAVREGWVKKNLDDKKAMLNIGSGAKYIKDFINCDLNEESGADLVFDLTQSAWPIPDDSTKLVVMHHVLEHLPSNIKTFFVELYRICANNALVNVRVPHPRHDWFLIDPTHVSAWHPLSFDFFDLNKCLKWYYEGATNTPLALYWKVDFEIVTRKMYSPSGVEIPQIECYSKDNSSNQNPIDQLNNTIGEIEITLKALKPFGSSRTKLLKRES